MTGNELSDKFRNIVVELTRYPDSVLTAAQLCAIMTETETLILNRVSLAPCSHPGSKYQKEGEDTQRCGVCSRPIEDDWRETLASA